MIGLSLPSVSYSLSLVGLLLALVGLSFVLWAGLMMLSRKWRNTGKRFEIPAKPLRLLLGLQVWKSLNIRVISGIVFGGVVGFLGGRNLHYTSIVPYHDVEVTRVFAPYRYELLIGDRKYKISICKNGPDPNWQVGETLRDLTWEEMGDCHRLYGPDVSFRELTDEATGKLILKETANVTQR